MRFSCYSEFHPGLTKLALVRAAIVPVVVVFHKRDALALDGMRDDCNRLAATVRYIGQSANERVQIMTIHFGRAPTEGLPFFTQRTERHNLVTATRSLPLVIVYNHGDIIQPLRRSEHGCLPHRAFVAFAVA